MSQENKPMILFVGNLPYSTTSDDLCQFIQKRLKLDPDRNKDLLAVRLLTSSTTGKSKGCAFVEFREKDPFLFEKALQLHKCEMFGKNPDGTEIRKLVNFEVTKVTKSSGKHKERLNKIKTKVKASIERKKEWKENAEKADNPSSDGEAPNTFDGPQEGGKGKGGKGKGAKGKGGKGKGAKGGKGKSRHVKK